MSNLAPKLSRVFQEEKFELYSPPLLHPFTCGHGLTDPAVAFHNAPTLLSRKKEHTGLSSATWPSDTFFPLRRAGISVSGDGHDKKDDPGQECESSTKEPA